MLSLLSPSFFPILHLPLISPHILYGSQQPPHSAAAMALRATCSGIVNIRQTTTTTPLGPLPLPLLCPLPMARFYPLPMPRLCRLRMPRLRPLPVPCLRLLLVPRFCSLLMPRSRSLPIPPCPLPTPRPRPLVRLLPLRQPPPAGGSPSSIWLGPPTILWSGENPIWQGQSAIFSGCSWSALYWRLVAH